MVYYTFGDSSIWTNNSMSSNGEAAMRVAKALAPGASTNIVLLPVLYYSAGSKTAVMRVYDAPSGGTLLRSATAAFQVFSVAESAAYTLSMSMAASSGLPGSIVPGVPTVVQATVVHPTSNATVYWSLINGESTTEMPAGTTAAPRTAVRPSASGTTFTLPAFTYTSSGTKRAIVKLYSAATGGSLLRYFVLQVMVESSDYTVSLTKISPSADATTLDYVSISADVTINIQQNSGPLYWSVDAGDGVLPPGGMLMASGAYGSVVDVPSYISYPGGPGSGRMWWNPFAASSNTNGSVNASSIVPNGGLQQSTLSVGVFKYITGGMKTISFWLWDASMGGNLLRSSTLLVSVTKLSVSASLAIEPTTTVTGTAYQRISTATVTGIDTNTYNYYFSFDMGPGGMYSARRRQSADLTPLGSNVYQINFLTSLAPEQLMYYSLGVKTARLQVFSSLKTVTDSDSVPMILEVEATANITVTTGVDITLSSNTAFLDQPSFTITSARVTGLSDGMDFRCKLSLLDEDGNAISAADYPATQMINDSPGMTQPFTVPTMSGTEYVARGRAPLLIEDPAWSLNVSKLQPFGNPTLRMPIILKLSYGHRPSATPTPSVYGMVSILLTTEEHENTVGMGFSASVDTYSSVNQEFQYNLPFYWFRTPGVKTIKAMLATGNGDSRFKRNIIRSTTFSLTILSPSLSAPAYYITRVRPTPVNPVFGQPATMAVTITRSWSPLNTTTAFVCKLFNGEGAEPQSYAAYQALSGADKSARAVMAAGGSSATCTFTGVVYNTVTQPGSRFHKILVFNEQTNEAVMSEPYGFDVSVSSVAATYSLVQSLTSMSPPNPVVGDPVNWTATISRSVQVTGSMPLEIECKLFTGEWTEPLSPDMYRRLPAPYTAVAPMYPNALTATCVWSGITYATAAAGRTAKIVVFENGVPLFATAQQVAQPFTVMPARAATSLTVLPDQDEYVGCFRDAAVYEERRLPFYLYERFGGADLESCAQAARQAGVPYYGLQDGDICLGGNDLAAATSLGPADCSAPCRAETASVCGGAFANSIYRVVRSSPDVIGNGTMLPDVPALCEPGYLVHNAHYFFTGGLITSSDARLRAQARLADDGSFQPPRQLTPTAWQLTGGPAGGAASWLGSYSPRTACGWVFRTPPGSVTTLRIRYLNTESYFDRLEIWPLLPAASSTSTVTADVPPNMTYSYAAVTSPAAAVAGSQNYLQVGSQTVAFISDTTSASASVALAVGTVFPVYSRTSPADTSTQLPASCYCAPGSSTLPYNATGPQIVYSRVFSSTSILVVFSQPVTVNLATCASAFVLQGAFDGMPLAATIPFSSCGLAAFTTGAQAAELPAAATSGTALVLRLASGFDTSMIPAGATSSIGVNLIAGQIAVRQGSVVLPAGGSPLQPMPLSLKALITAPPFDTVTDACVTQCRPPSFDAAPMVRAVAGVPGADANPVEALRARGAAALAAVSSATPLAAFSGALSQSEFAEPLLTLHNDFMVYFRSDAANNLDGFIIEYNVTTAAAAAAYMPSYQTAVGTGGPSGTFDPAAYTSDLNTYYSYRNRVGGDVYDRVFASNATAGCARTLYYQPPAAADGMWLLNCGAAGQQ
ncbi:hypothetical protein HXX76_012145 [Chlamydomonas incerta]|uniref:WSC domain-containing protein n=1 Tax=Chlamydomonas incerta TaxID=51695 RepID=A0A835SIM3_CHLIN|nr:hypothetical protein HXX76_012145 [Chlamydomonas incerta]|eukprot:KAG2427823.1 hypothetical protein HXX76_012145 [Chlamydomonas incerta]